MKREDREPEKPEEADVISVNSSASSVILVGPKVEKPSVIKRTAPEEEEWKQYNTELDSLLKVKQEKFKKYFCDQTNVEKEKATDRHKVDVIPRMSMMGALHQ